MDRALSRPSLNSKSPDLSMRNTTLLMRNKGVCLYSWGESNVEKQRKSYPFDPDNHYGNFQLGQSANLYDCPQ